MSASVISSVVPPSATPLWRTGCGWRSGSVLAGSGTIAAPVVDLPQNVEHVYGLAALDDRGRVADRVVMRALGWRAGLHLVIEETGGVLTINADPHGDCQVTSQGPLRLPAPLRHRCALAAGDRVLLAADPDRSRLAIYPPAALDNALAQPADTAGGEPA